MKLMSSLLWLRSSREDLGCIRCSHWKFNLHFLGATERIIMKRFSLSIDKLLALVLTGPFCFSSLLKRESLSISTNSWMPENSRSSLSWSFSDSVNGTPNELGSSKCVYRSQECSRVNNPNHILLLFLNFKEGEIRKTLQYRSFILSKRLLLFWFHE